MPGRREEPFDLIVVGGGINGAAIARDATLRGLSVALFEMRDLSTGATWSSSGMVHGGLRYLQSDPDVTRLACVDSGYIQAAAPHLIFRIPFLMPWREGGFTQRFVFELAEVYFDAYDRYQPFKRGKRHSRLSREELLQLEPGIHPGVMGGLTMDEWGIDAQRITVINALHAEELGARVRTWTRVERLVRGDGGRVLGVRIHDRIGGERCEVFGRVVFNASGAWGMEFARREGIETVRIRPGKGTHIVYPGRLSNYAVVAKAVDGRQVFLCPQQNHSIVGTTDDDYYGDMERVAATHDEVEYLVEAMESVLPGFRSHRAIGTTVGCRPTIHGWGRYEDRLSREHRIRDHAADGAQGLFSIWGGKLASYRSMAEDAVNAVVAVLGKGRSCSTREARLPGGEPHDIGIREFEGLGVDAVAATRILYRHGSRAESILGILREDPSSRALVDPFEPVTEAELRYCIRRERVETLDDLKRRCRLGTGTDGGARSAIRAAQIFCEEKSLAADAVPDLARHFLQARWEDRRAVLHGRQAGAEALWQTHAYLSQGRAVSGAAE